MWTDNSLLFASVDRIPLGDVIPTMVMFYDFLWSLRSTDVCYKYE